VAATAAAPVYQGLGRALTDSDAVEVRQSMKTERLDTRTSRGGRVAVWRSAPGDPAPDCPVVVLNAGFARRMRDVGSIALCLARNGAVVYRFDSVDHLGLSDGGITAFTLTAMTESLQAAIELARSVENQSEVRLVALSLSNLAAYRLAARDSDIDRIMAISGVVHGLRTLEKVLGHNYATVEFDDLPERVRVLGHEIDPRPLWTDQKNTGCLTYSSAIEQLKKIAAPVVNCVAADDPWVDIGDCSHAFDEGSGGDRMIIKLPYSGHDPGGNPGAITTILQKMTRMAVSTGSPHDADSFPVDLPGFDELLELRIAERSREMSEQTAAPNERKAAR